MISAVPARRAPAGRRPGSCRPGRLNRGTARNGELSSSARCPELQPGKSAAGLRLGTRTGTPTRAGQGRRSPRAGRTARRAGIRAQVLEESRGELRARAERAERDLDAARAELARARQGNRGRRNPGRGIAASPRPGQGVGTSGGTGHAPRLEIQPGRVPLAPPGSAPMAHVRPARLDQASLRRRRGEPGGLAWSRRRRTPSCTPGCHRAFRVPRMELAAAESFPAREQLGVLELEILHRHGRYSGHRSRYSGHGEPPSVD